MPCCEPGSDGVFAPGHLGELTQVITSALVDEVLEATRRVQHRVRKLPSRVMVYFVLAMALFGADSYRGVWASLTSGLKISTPDPSSAALRQARRRIGAGPLVALFNKIKGPVAGSVTCGAWWRELRVVAWDGTELEVADTVANAGFFGRHSSTHGSSGYPQLRLSALVECGTRALIGATFGPLAQHEKKQAQTLCSCLGPGMVLLADRGSDSHDLMRAAAATGAHLLWRVQRHRVLPMVHALPDGTYLSMIADVGNRTRLKTWASRRCSVPPQVQGVAVRVLEVVVTVTSPGGTTTSSSVRLVTTLLDHERYPAGELAALYHQRWEAETAYYGLKVTLRGNGRVLRSGTPGDVEQELFGLLIVYQAARRIGADAAADAGIDPDRISLTVTLRTARHTVINGERLPGLPEDTPTPKIHAAILHPRELGPRRRRPRILPRRVKRTISPFAYNKTRNNKPQRDVTVTLTIQPPKAPLTSEQDP